MHQIRLRKKQGLGNTAVTCGYSEEVEIIKRVFYYYDGKEWVGKNVVTLGIPPLRVFFPAGDSVMHMIFFETLSL